MTLGAYLMAPGVLLIDNSRVMRCSNLWPHLQLS
jgi:hypothetical protein